MAKTLITHRGTAVIWLCTGALSLSSCGGGGGSSNVAGASSDDTDSGGSAPAVVLTDMQPLEHGFAFANFPASWYSDEFVADDLVAMFGADPSVCVGGVEPCELTAEATAFARMVNQSRAVGHCEGLVAVAQARFNERSDPPTATLLDDTDTIKAILRAFATQFIPEVRDEVSRWLGTSLAEKVSALETSLAEGNLTYSLGVYVADGGHAILPYAIEYLTPTRPRIMVYDSNWPGRNRWVDVDLETETWTFSFSGDDPDADPDLWSGDAGRLDLTGIDTRAGSCPFCEGGITTTKNVLLVRSTDLDWSVEAGDTAIEPGSETREADGVVITPVKGQSGSGRTSFDYLIELPTPADGERAKLNLPGTTSVFALTPTGIAQITTPGNPDVPVEVGESSFVSADPAVSLTVAVGNLVATATGPTASLEIAPEGLNATVTTDDGSSRSDARLASWERDGGDRVSEHLSITRPWSIESVIVHIPHASTLIPATERPSILLSDTALSRELRASTDQGTAAVAQRLGPTTATVAKATLSRLVFDPERFAVDDPAESTGRGLMYTRTADGRPLRHEPENGSMTWYREQHRLYTRSIEHVVRRAIERHEPALIIALHSYPTEPHAYEDPARERPEVCIGTDPHHTPTALVDLAQSVLSPTFTIGIDTPYSGAYVPGSLHLSDAPIESIMIEVRRDVLRSAVGRDRIATAITAIIDRL